MKFCTYFTSQAALMGKEIKQADTDWEFRIKRRIKKITFLMKKCL
jgi:hypothetical protein